MTLRKKTLSIIAVTLVVLVAVSYLLISTIVRSSFTELEEDDVTRHVQRVVEAIENELAQISVNAQDNALPGTRAARMAELFDNYASTVTPSGLSGRVDLLVNRLGGANVLLLTDTSGKMILGLGL